MSKLKGFLWTVTTMVSLGLATGLAFADQRVLTSDEIKALISDKTVHVTRKHDGAQWKIFFGADGKSLSSDTGEGTWEVSGSGEHCNSGIKLKCAKVVDNGDGTYSRLKPNGDVAVTWTKIVAGKEM